MSEDAEFSFISKCSAVVVDVAGTTTSIDYVEKTLFPFANENCEAFMKANFEKEDVKKAVKLLKDDIADVDSAVTAFKELGTDKSENEGFKLIQGLIYKEGYVSEKLKAHIFSDIPSAFETWAKTMKVAIYSTGSIESQKLLFSHTTEGNLSTHIAHYFDQTNIGSKTEKDSYEKIAKKLDVKPEQVAFISDNIKELKAAKESNLFTVLVKREGNEEVPESEAKDHFVITTFTDLVGTGKRKCPVDETTEIKEPPTKVAKLANEEAKSADKPIAAEKTEEVEKMEVDSTTESKKDQEVVATKQDEKEITEAEETKESETKMVTNQDDSVTSKVAEATPKENKDKEEEITSTNEEEEVKKPVDDKSKSQTEEAMVTEDTTKKSDVDSTDAVVAPSTTTNENAVFDSKEDLKVDNEQEMVVDNAKPDKEKTVETKGEPEKTDNTVVNDDKIEVLKVEEKKADVEKETEEISNTVEKVVPSEHNGDSEHNKKTEEGTEKTVTEEAESTAVATASDTSNGEAVKVDEKENKSEMANGKAENGNANGNASVEEETKADEEKSSSDDIKVKKIEDASEATAPVSVEA